MSTRRTFFAAVAFVAAATILIVFGPAAGDDPYPAPDGTPTQAAATGECVINTSTGPLCWSTVTCRARTANACVDWQYENVAQWRNVGSCQKKAVTNQCWTFPQVYCAKINFFELPGCSEAECDVWIVISSSFCDPDHYLP